MIPTTNESKYLRVAAQIETELRGGAWDGGKMPSVRGIATQHGVSVVTASRALQVLRDKGLIQTIERSGCYRIPPPTADRWAVCLRLTPGAMQRYTTSVVLAGFQTLARRVPMHLVLDAFDVKPGLKPEDAKAAARQALDDGIRGVFLLPSRVSDEEAKADEAFLLGCDAAALPVVLMERNVRGRSFLSHDLVAIDDVAAARECTEHLFAIGRKRVGIVIASPVSSHNDRVAGYLLAVHEAKHTTFARKSPPPEVVIRQPIDLPTREAYSAIADEVLRHKLDGLLCYQDYTALGVIVELLQRRMRVPDDLAVIGFDNLPLGQEFGITLSTYDYPAEAMADCGVKLMKDRIALSSRPPVKVLIPGKLIVRESTQSADV
jgi:LacI family transcriptional regulator